MCETDKTIMCELKTIDLSGTFKFNAYNEMQFSIGRTYIDITTGKTEVHPFYDKIEALRLVYLDGFGYFEIQEPEIVSDGIKEVKNVTAYGLEYSLSQKYLEEMYVNTGENDSIEVIQGGGVALHPIPLYDPTNTKLSLLHIVLEKVYGWTIGHIDESLKTMTRTFEVDRASVYDFITQDICDKFNCFAVFDTIENTINLYAESLVSKFVADGKQSSFVISTPYSTIDVVTIGGYPTTDYTYNTQTGVLTFNYVPAKGSMIEVTDGSQNQWRTDVYVSFDNLAQEAQINYSADDIKTVLTVKGADDLEINEVNMGNPYIVDLSYYYSVEWMGQELYDAYTEYLQKCNDSQLEYKLNEEAALELSNHISYEENRQSLKYTVANNIVSTTVGTYFVRGGSDPNYYYTEVSLPEEFNSEVTYYTLYECHLNEEKVGKLYDAIVAYYSSDNEKNTEHIDDLAEDFAFMTNNTISSLSRSLKNASSLTAKDTAVYKFLDEMWDQVGRTPLLSQYRVQYVQRQDTNKDNGYDHPENEYYMTYHATELFINSIDTEVQARNQIIEQYSTEYTEIKNENKQIANSVLMDVFFENYYINQGCSALEAKQKAMKLLVRISPFLREDEYVDDNFVVTESDTIEMIMNTKQALLECGRIELAKLCEPKLSFSMDMANIFALKEFEPIIYQFQLGNLINVVLRSDYIKRARLLSVNINFNDFSDFSCEFGELTSLKTPSSIHADLLSAALVAGKSVASNASYWSKGADLATSTYQKIQQGLLDSTTGIYSSDQGVIIDKQGIKLTKVIDHETGEVHPAQAWLRNNMILLTDDGWKTARTGLGEFTIGNRTFYGLLADAMLAGYIEGSEIVGGTINIGNGNFVVDINGVVTMRSEDNVIEGYAKTDYVENKYSTLEKTIDGFRTTVGNTYSTKEEVSGLGNQITGLQDNVSGVQNQLNNTNQNVSAISTRVTAAETNIVQNSDAIKISATKTEVQTINANLQGQINTANTNVSNLTKRVTTAETSITQNSDSITSLATRTTANENSLSGVTGRVSAAETKITQNAESITSLASRTSTVENKFGNYSTTAQMNSAIKQSADSISSTVSSTYATKTYVDGEVGVVETRVENAETSISQNTSAIELKASKTEVSNAIDNITVGGRNLLLKTNQGKTGWGWTMQTGDYTSSEVVEDTIKTVKFVRGSVEQTGWSVITYGNLARSLIKPATQYTLSFDVKSSVTSYFGDINIKDMDSSDSIIKTKSISKKSYTADIWTKCQIVFTTLDVLPSSTTQVIYLQMIAEGSIVGVTYQFRNLKLEEGNKATAWSPAPEDIVGKTEIVSAINLSPETIKIKSDKISLEGFVSVNEAFSIDEEGDMIANSGQIGGFDITDGSLECDITEDFSNITSADQTKVRDYILGNTTLTDAEFEKFDVAGSYQIGATNLLYMQQILSGTVPKTAQSKMSINLNSAKDAILLEGLTGFKKGWKTRIGVGGIKTKNVNATDVVCDRVECEDVDAEVVTTLELHSTSLDTNHIEFNSDGLATDHGGYIDFHYAGSTADYTSRIIESSSGKIDIKCPNGFLLNGQKVWNALYIGSGASCTFTTSLYDFIIVLASPANGYTAMSCVVPTANAGSAFQVADEANFTKFTLNSTGITRSSGTGLLIAVYGVNLT